MLIYRGDTLMNFKNNMDNVIEYIESNLNDTIDYNILQKRLAVLYTTSREYFPIFLAYH